MASELASLVEFEYRGSSELLVRLTKPEDIERVGNGGSEPRYPKSTEGLLGGQLVF